MSLLALMRSTARSGVLLALMRSTARSGVLLAALFGLVSITSLSGCSIFKSNCDEDDRTCLGGGFQRSGGECGRNGDCAIGLECIDEICEYAHATKAGQKCRATEECAANLYCSKDLKCEPINADAQGEGGACGSSADCKQGLACDLEVSTLFTEGPFGALDEECQMIATSVGTGTGEVPDGCKLPMKCQKRGNKDSGKPCKSSAECLAGLYCAPNIIDPDSGTICFGSPTPLEQEPISLPVWDGEKCPEDEADPTAYFQVPRAEGNKDFYRLPFPNDIRKKGDGTVDLSGHPVPPSSLDVPVVERFISAAGTSLRGFATNPVVYFRFSEPYAASGDSNQAVLDGSIRIIDITKSSPTYNLGMTTERSPSGLSSHYICPNWLALRPSTGAPLRASTTYAAILTNKISTAKSNGSTKYARSADLDAMLGASKPSDPALATAYDAYAPLRAWIADPKANIDAGSILNVAVFTTQDPESVLPALREAVIDSGAPTLSEMVVCDEGVISPCVDPETKRGACEKANADFTVIHGRVALPIFQKGTAPYETPEQGGAIEINGSGKAVKQANPGKPVCFAMSIPKKKPMPAAGYPVLLYAHGTGGSFSGQMGAGGPAADVANGPTPGVIIAIDMPEHGDRRGESKRPPEDLFFNFANPEGARGNVLQGSADLMSLALLARSGGITAADSPTGAAIRLDPKRVMVFGHSQGATHAAIMLPFEAGVDAGILSGVGGHLAVSMLSKKKPVDIAAILPFVLFDATDTGKLVGGIYNPVLSIVQMFFESADPVNYAHRVAAEPADSAPKGHHLFMTYGLDDNFSPEETQEAYALAAKLTVVTSTPTSSGLGGLLTPIRLTPAQPGLRENVTFDTTLRTVGMRQYDPTVGAIGPMPSDGHFVSTQTTQGRADTSRFTLQVLDGKAPQIGE